MEIKLTVPEYKIEAFRHAVEILNARARRLGAPEAVVELGPFRLHEGREIADVVVRGLDVLVPGWRLVAKVVFVEEEGKLLPVVLKVGDGAEVGRDIDQRCEHCDLDRNRLQVFVLESGDGERKVVGSTCVDDFVGVRGARQLFDFAVDAVVRLGAEGWEESGGCGGCGGGRAWWSLSNVLAAVSAVTRRFGWMSRRQAYEESCTATIDLALLFLARSPADSKLFKGVTLGRGDLALAKRAAHWAAQLDPDAESDFLASLSAVARGGYVVPRVAGIAGALVNVYLDHRTRLVRERVRAEHLRPGAELPEPPLAKRKPKARPTPAWAKPVEPKPAYERMQLEVVVAGLGRPRPTDYGTSTRVELVDVASGAALVWYSSNVPDEVRPGALLRVCASFVDRKQQEDGPVTVVNRVSVGWPAPKVRKPRKKAAEKISHA